MMNPNLEGPCERLASAGWCVLEQVVPAACIGSASAQFLTALGAHKNPDPRRRLGKISGLVNCDQSLAPYFAETRLRALCDRFLGKHFRISFTTGMATFPGNERGALHADWPFNQHNASHIPTPYPDVVAGLTTIWMLSDFSEGNGGTTIVPGSHLTDNNPSGDPEIDEGVPHPDEMQVTGDAGSVLVMDSRLWHAISANTAKTARLAAVVRYSPWWLNLAPLRPGSPDRQRMMEETGLKENSVPPVPDEVFAHLPPAVQPLFRHWREPA